MYTMIDVKYTQEDFFMSAEFLDFILEVVISYLVPILELIGVLLCRLWNDKIICQIYTFRSKFR